MDCSLPGSSVHGILQARILEWAVMPFSRGSSLLRDWIRTSCFSCISGVLYCLSHQLLKSLQSCPTLCDPIDGSPPGSPIPGSLQARTLEWVAISVTNAWKWSRSVMSDSLRPHGLQPTRLRHPWDFPGVSTGVGCHCLLLSHQGSPIKYLGDLMNFQELNSTPSFKSKLNGGKRELLKHSSLAAYGGNKRHTSEGD